MRQYFDSQLKELNKSLQNMGSLCEDCITCATQALLTGSSELGDKAIELEHETDIYEREIQSLCMKILYTQQPVARDLKTVSAALKMITDLERIGDQGSDIAELLRHTSIDIRSNSSHIAAMADATIKMVTGSVDAFVRHDAQLAVQVARQDDEVDALFTQVKDDVLTMITSGEKHDRNFAEQVLDTLMIAKYLEHIGDHAVNVTEAVRMGLGETEEN